MNRDTNSHSPMMRQYLEQKELYPTEILFFRMGDFYEMFFDDAILASRELDITLTSREAGSSTKAPMAGVPHHSSTGYIKKLIEKGYKVAICEQLEDPATVKGLVKRGVVRVITPGTVLEDELLESKASNYMASLAAGKGSYSLALSDISTGQITVLRFGEEISLINNIRKYAPKELLIHQALSKGELYQNLTELNTLITVKPKSFFELSRLQELIRSNFGYTAITTYGLDDGAIDAVGGLIRYTHDIYIQFPPRFNSLTVVDDSRSMNLDYNTVSNLELISSNKKSPSLLSVIDNTLTSMGARKLRMWLLSPSTDIGTINERLDKVEYWHKNSTIVQSVISYLSQIRDIERLNSKLVTGKINPKDVIALSSSLAAVSEIKKIVHDNKIGYYTGLVNICAQMNNIISKIDAALNPDAPILLSDGNVIKTGYDKELDEIRELVNGGQSWILSQEAGEREKTGIKTLKIGYSRTFGYFIEVSAGAKKQVPEHYIRKQTLTNAERYITPELKEKETQILNAQSLMLEAEVKLYNKLISELSEYYSLFAGISDIIAELDIAVGLSVLARENNYIRPVIDETNDIEIVDGRHPVVEKLLGANQFITNHTSMVSPVRFVVLTGPNMAGKSTYMRQIATIIIMAQIGSFVPARSARIGLTDKIFTRIGAVDDMASGQSTFMVEMSETANILNYSTSRSLVILDEIGRGTSTYDGISLAWALSEYIIDTIQARTIFATHYHELYELVSEYDNGSVIGLQMQVIEKDDNIIFMRKVVEGGANHSYGIEVAKYAGIPPAVVDRAKDVLSTMEKSSKLLTNLKKTHKIIKKDSKIKQIDIFENI